MSSSKKFESDVFFSDQVSESFTFPLDTSCLADKVVDQLEAMYMDVMGQVEQWEKDGVVNAMATVKYVGYRDHTKLNIDLTATKPWSDDKITEYKKNMLVAKKKAKTETEIKNDDQPNAELEKLRALIDEYPDTATEYLLQRITGNIK